MSENDFSKLPVPKEAGPELDLLLALHMGWKHWSGNELSLELNVEGAGNNKSSVVIPKFSTDHNAFFEHVASYFVNLDMSFVASYLIEDQMWKVVIKNEKESFVGREYELPYAGTLAAISALGKIR